MLAKWVLIALLAQGANPLTQLVRRAQEDFAAGKFSEARAELRQALQLSPNDAVLWSYLGVTDSSLHDAKAAIGDFEKACALNPGNAKNYFHLGQLYRIQGDAHQALEAYQQGLALNPDDPSANENYARLLMEASRYAEAIVPLERLKKSFPSELPLRAMLLECCLRGGLEEEAEKEIREFLSPTVSSPKDQLKLASVLEEKGLLDPAGAVLAQVGLASPNFAEAHALLGRLFLEKAQYDNASTELRKAVELAPASAEYAMWLAEALLLGEHYDAALEFLMALKDQAGSLPEYRYKIGLAYYGMNQYSKAIDQLEELAREQPDLDRVQFFLGNSYAAVGELERAETYYKRAIALNPNDASYYPAMAELLRGESDARADEAIQYLQKGLQLDPNNARSRLELGLCYEKKKDYSQAERLLQQVTREHPEMIPAHVALARVYYREHRKQDGDRERAIVSQYEAGKQMERLQSSQSSPHP